MKESEIRQVLRRVCLDLDARAAAHRARVIGGALVAPAMVGASLACAPGCSGTSDTGPPSDAATNSDTPSDQTAEMVALYMAPFDAGDSGAVQPPYMAPDTGVMPLYMAASDAATDSGPQMDYMAPYPDDSGNMPLYMATPADGSS
jgi:hypothetical protein